MTTYKKVERAEAKLEDVLDDMEKYYQSFDELLEYFEEAQCDMATAVSQVENDTNNRSISRSIKSMRASWNKMSRRISKYEDGTAKMSGHINKCVDQLFALMVESTEYVKRLKKSG